MLCEHIKYDYLMDFAQNVYVNIGKNIKKLRLEKGISQEKLSDLLDTNSKFIGHIERVERYISLKKLIQLAQILEVPVEDLVKIEN